MGILYIVATPIGNLEDITLRALETLKNVDLIACEDTRVTRKLLNHYNIDKPTISYFQHSKLAKLGQIIDELKSGKNVALVTDAGTPGISDPGNKLVEEVIRNGIKVIPIPGPAALTALVSVAGIDMQRFVFLGYPPHKKGRMSFITEAVKSEYPVVLYESKYRILKLLKELCGYSGLKRINLIIGKEITKIYEEIVRGTPEEILNYFENNENKLKGEFVIIVHKK